VRACGLQQSRDRLTVVAKEANGGADSRRFNNWEPNPQKAGMKKKALGQDDRMFKIFYLSESHETASGTFGHSYSLMAIWQENYGEFNNCI
jgi:hypothetical protein